MSAVSRCDRRGFVIAFSELTITFAYKKVLFYLPEGMAPTGLMQLLSTDYKIALSFVILVIVLLIRPTGLFGGKRCDQRKYQKAAAVCGNGASADYRRHFPELEPRFCRAESVPNFSHHDAGGQYSVGYAGLVNFGMMGSPPLAASVGADIHAARA